MKKSAGKIADRYIIEKKLGHGGSGDVYLARDLKNQEQRVALKLVEAKKSLEDFLASTLQNEFATLTLLQHPNLCRVLDFQMTKDEVFFTSEWIEGVDILSATPKSNLNTVFQLILQILRALDYLHQRGVFHLDLKPANILVTDPEKTGELTVKLIDFGLAQWRRQRRAPDAEFSGTPPYSAPELLLGQTPSTASDIYSLGMLLHQIFAGKFPFSHQDPVAILQEQIYGQAQRVDSLHMSLPDSMGELLFKMVAREPQNRPQTAREVLHAINQSLSENFSLRSPTAPISILDESDFIFRKKILEDLVTAYASPTTRKILLTGPPGIGKNRLLRRTKELLQLRGIYPLLLNSFPPEGLFEDGPSAFSLPLFLDLSAKELKLSYPQVLALEKLKSPLLIAVEKCPSDLSPSFEVLPIPPLAENEIKEFLEKEIMGFPLDRHTSSLTAMSGGSPKSLEILLQAMREEGWIQWTDQGWRWVAEAEQDFSKLLPNHETRWAQRLTQTLELLKSSPIGLDASALEGMLGLESGALTGYLDAWVLSGKISSQVKGEKVLYFPLQAEAAATPDVHPAQNWEWVREELEKLYDFGEFRKGVQWAKLFLSADNPPPEVRIVGARHHVAAGLAKEALDLLPSAPPPDPRWRGLLHEVRARSFSNLGDFSQAQRELDLAKKDYSTASFQEGIVRLLILQGSISKRLGNFSESEASLVEAIQKARDINFLYSEGLAEMNRGTLYHDRGEFDKAQEAYERAFSIAKKFPHPLLELTLQHNWVNLLYYTGRSAEAEAACFEWLKKSIHFQDITQQAVALNFLALLAGQKGLKDKKLDYLNQAISLMNPHTAPQLLAQALIDRGYVYWDRQKWTSALLDAEAALDLALKRSNIALSGWGYLLVGKILRDQLRPDMDRAREHLEKALQVIRETKNRQILWEAEFDLGLLAKKNNNPRVAQDYFRAAEQDLRALMADIPETLKKTYLRDRKLERILAEIGDSHGTAKS